MRQQHFVAVGAIARHQEPPRPALLDPCGDRRRELFGVVLIMSTRAKRQHDLMQ